MLKWCLPSGEVNKGSLSEAIARFIPHTVKLSWGQSQLSIQREN
ncbi:hypothetical protein [Anabaena sp. 4-3]|nr:hypothetical protein [Anabaena sp. 4-3]